jgi:hypothetical protein
VEAGRYFKEHSMAKAVTFHSKYTEHEIIRRPRFQAPLPQGGWQTIGEPRISFNFHAAPSPDGGGLIGVCHVLPGRNKMVDGDGWLAAGMEQVERDDVEALRAHNAFGQDFWEAPVPVTDLRREIRLAGVNLNEEGLVAIIAEEQRTAKRADLLEDAEGTLAAVRETLAQAQAQAEAEAAEAAKKPAAKAKATA